MCLRQAEWIWMISLRHFYAAYHPFTMEINADPADRPALPSPDSSAPFYRLAAITILRVDVGPEGCDAGVFFSIRT